MSRVAPTQKSHPMGGFSVLEGSSSGGGFAPARAAITGKAKAGEAKDHHRPGVCRGVLDPSGSLFMAPLPDAVSVLLRTNARAALAALMVIAKAHQAVFSWAARTFAEPGGAGNGNGHSRPVKRAARQSSGLTDESLLEAMRDSPTLRIGDWAEAIGKSRTSVVTSLHRLRDAGLVENHDRRWRLTEPEAPMAPPERWTKPLHGDVRAAHAHLTAS